MRSWWAWLEHRTGVGQLLRTLVNEKLPAGAGWWWTLGAVLLFLLTLQALTGLALAMYYVPAPSLAYPSVRFLMTSVPFGALVRGLHVWGASGVVIAALVHLARVFLSGAYKAPREVTWVSGMTLLLIIFGLALTGYLLPWDQKAYWATAVTINIARTTPLVGDGAASWLQGGPTLGALTLGRWYVAHVMLLPAMLVLLVVAHVALVRRHGVAGPARGRSGPPVAFFPGHVAKDTLVVAAVLGLLVAVALTVPAPLEERAQPTATDYVPRPEWYFLALFQLLTYLPGRLELVATLLIPCLVVGGLLALPFLDRSPARHPLHRSRRAFTAILSVLLIGAVALTVRAMRDRPAGFDPADWSPLAIAGATLVESEGTGCSRCHHTTGSAAPLELLPGVRDDAWQLAHVQRPGVIDPLDDAGRPAEAPLDGSLGPREAQAVLAYLRRVAVGSVPPAVDATEQLAATTFARQCAGCHRIAGEGGQVGPDLTQVGARRSPDTIRQILTDPASVFSNPRMPAFRRRLTEEQVTALATYLGARR